MNSAGFFACLFDPGESTCFAADPKGTKVSAVTGYDGPAMFFCINPLDPLHDRKPHRAYHRREKPRRADANVTVFRNILVEMVRMTPQEQMEHVLRIGLPYSTAVFSGGKSIHFVISLETQMSSRAEYQDLVRRIYDAIGGKDIVDVANSNPSRLSRCPNVIRPETGKPQKLIQIKGRVNVDKIEHWLGTRGFPKHIAQPVAVTSNVVVGRRGCDGFPILNGFTRNFLMFGAANGTWNSQLFKAACNMAEVGVAKDDAVNKFKCITGKLDESDLRSIESAYCRTRR